MNSPFMFNLRIIDQSCRSFSWVAYSKQLKDHDAFNQESVIQIDHHRTTWPQLSSFSSRSNFFNIFFGENLKHVFIKNTSELLQINHNHFKCSFLALMKNCFLIFQLEELKLKDREISNLKNQWKKKQSQVSLRRDVRSHSWCISFPNVCIHIFIHNPLRSLSRFLMLHLVS